MKLGGYAIPLYLELHLLMVGKGGGYCGIRVHNDVYYHLNYTYYNNKKITPHCPQVRLFFYNKSLA